MNTLRLFAIVLPVTLLMACGGGGSSGGTAAAPTPMNPPTNMPGMDDPMNPGTGDPMNPPTTTPTVMLETLPAWTITNLDMARTAVGGTAPTAANTMTETAIISAIQSRAEVADTFEFSDFGPTANAVSVTCTNSNKSCTTGNVDNVGTLTFSLVDIEDLSLVNETGLVGFDSDTRAVMVDEGVTMIESRDAGRQSDGTQLTFQTYGGWLANSVFGVELLGVTENGTPTNRFASFSFGKASGNSPTEGTGVLHWTGAMVGTNTTTGDIIQGVTDIIYIPSSNILHQVEFSNVKNLNTGNDVLFVGNNVLQFQDIPLTNGRFESANGEVRGRFFGTNHEEVGGIFNSGSNNIIGAFGAKK